MDCNMFHYMQPNIGHSARHLRATVSDRLLLNRRVIAVIIIIMAVAVRQY